MEQCYQNNNLVCQQIRNTMNYHHHKFNVYEQHFGVLNNDIPLNTVPPNPFNLWFPPANPYYGGLFQYTTGTVYRLDNIDLSYCLALYTPLQNVWHGSKSVVTFGLIKILSHPC